MERIDSGFFSRLVEAINDHEDVRGALIKPPYPYRQARLFLTDSNVRTVLKQLTQMFHREPRANDLIPGTCWQCMTQLDAQGGCPWCTYASQHLIKPSQDVEPHPIVEVDAECTHCKGTGLVDKLFLGAGTNVATICHRCRGRGGVFRRVRLFTHRKPPKAKFSTVHVHQEQTQGTAIDAWMRDAASVFAPGAEDRIATCPAQWYVQVDPRLKPRWAACETLQSENGRCEAYSNRSVCWSFWDHHHRDAADALYQIRRRRMSCGE